MEDLSAFLDVAFLIAISAHLLVKVALYFFYRHENKKVYNLFYYTHHQKIILTRDRNHAIPSIQNFLSISAVVLLGLYLCLEIFVFHIFF